jgi:hypothetical protein
VRISRALVAPALGLAALVGGIATPAAAQAPEGSFRLQNRGAEAQEPRSVTPIAYQQFERGFMLWRQDNGQITVGYRDILTKTNNPCQEIYRDTYQGQSYEIPPAPSGLAVPTLGFGWLYSNDQQLARRIGYATADEVSRVAEIRTRTGSGGEQTLELRLSEPIPGVANPLVVAFSDEPGLTYCFARGSENRAALNTWVALQRYQYGFMMWRQDQPDRIEVVHYDTELAPELNCVDRFRDTWAPGEVLSYGPLAVPGQRLPERGFGKVWLDNPYVRESLGYAVEPETGGFAEITFEPFRHPRRGELLVRRTQVQLAGGGDFNRRTTIPGGDIQRENRPSEGCRGILIPHAR